MPLISVIVPYYNAEDYLPACLVSITHQTFADWEILLINDGSTDRGPAIAEAFAQTDSRIRLFAQPNQGQSVARNLGIRQAQGEWIAFVDADDTLDYGFLEAAVNGIRTTEKELDVVHLYPRHTFYRYTAPWTKLYRKAFIEYHGLQFPVGLRRYEDIIFTLDVWTARPKYICLPPCGYRYTVRPDSNSRLVQREDKHKLFAMMRERYCTAKSLRDKLLILYTVIRVRGHFIVSKHEVK